ncbi:MFS transporter [Aquipuribacter sp. SD81]|uniref:MFS transporter n=1 Tax=Aquipuribacter sp. SD81 TaxID=3127703 RepID=UPI00301B40C3
MHNERYAGSSRDRVLGLAAVLASTAGLGLSYGIGYTVTTVRFAEWGAAGWLVGLAGAVPALAVVLLVPFAPRLVARVGAVPAMVAGAALVGATFLLMPVLEGVGWWLLLRLLSGAGLTLPWLVGETWINTVVPDRVRGRVLAVYAMLLFSGWAAGPLVLERTGTDGWAGYLVGAGATVVLCVPLVAARRLAPAVGSSGRFSPRTVAALAPLALAAAVVGGVAEFGWISLLPAYALDAGAGSTASLRLLTVLLVGGILLQPLVGWLADHVDRTQVLVGLGAALAVVSTALAPVVAAAGPAAFAVAFVLGGVVMGFYAVGLTMLGEQVPPAVLAAANGAFLVAYETGATVGPVLGGAATDLWRPHGLVVLVAAVGVAFAVLAPRLASRPAPEPGERPRARSLPA